MSSIILSRGITTIAILLLMIHAAAQPEATGQELADLSSWTVVNLDFEAHGVPGEWLLLNDNTKARQVALCDPTLLLSDVDDSSYSFRGTFRVLPTGDDDFIGIVFGYQDSSHFYVADWKKEYQNHGGDYGIAKEGFSVKRISAPSFSLLSVHDFFQFDGTEYSTVLDYLYGDGSGWENDSDYVFQLNFHHGAFEVLVMKGTDTLWVADVDDGTYESGQFGFYNFSQELAEYTAFEFQRTCSLVVSSDGVCLEPTLTRITLTVDNADSVAGMTIPLRFDTDCPDFAIDPVVFGGTRIEDWEYRNVDIRSDTVILALVADMGGGTPPLPPGEGPIVFIYFNVECSPENVNDTCCIYVDTCTFQPDNQGLLFVDSDARAYVPYFESGTTCVAQYKPGDTNCDYTRNLADVIYLLNYLFRGGPEPCPLDAGDVNGDCVIDIGDPVYLLNYLFKGGPPPVCGCASHPESARCCPNGGDWSGFAKSTGEAELGVVPGTGEKENSLEITGSLSTDVAGLQLEISYDPEKVTSIIPRLTERTNTLQLFSSARNGLLKLGIVDLAAKNLIKAGDGPLVRLNIGGGDLSSVEINKAVLVDQDAKPLNVRILPKSEAGAARPATFSLHQNHPNPFNPETDISYSIPVDGRMALSIYNVRGQKVKTLVESNQAAGYYTVHWDGTDEQGRKVASGIYFYRLQAGERTETKKMILMK